jgi:hypothetical protein
MSRELNVRRQTIIDKQACIKSGSEMRGSSDCYISAAAHPFRPNLAAIQFS